MENVLDRDILTMAQVAEALSMEAPSVRALLEAGELPGRRIGYQWYVTRRKLLAFIEGGEAGSDRSASAPKPPPSVDTNVFPLNNGWRCGRCDQANEPDRVECAHCGRARSVPLINFRLGT